MAAVKIRWTQRVMGRSPGQEETVERTDLIEAMAAQGRILILEPVADHIALLGVVEPAVLEEVFVDMSAPDEPVEDTPTEDVAVDVPPPAQIPTPGDIVRPGPRRPPGRR